MKTRKIWIFAFGLMFICSTLSGCKGKNKQEVTTTPVVDSVKEKAAKVDKRSFSNDSVLISVGQTQVTSKEVYTYMYILKNQYEPVMGAELWQQKLEGNMTLEAQSISEIVQMIIQMKIIGKYAANNGITLTVDENEEVNARTEKLIQTAGDYLTQHEITREVVTTVFADNEMSRKVYDIVTGSVVSSLTEEQIESRAKEANLTKEQVILEKQNEVFQSEYEKWMKDYDVRLSDMLWTELHF